MTSTRSHSPRQLLVVGGDGPTRRRPRSASSRMMWWISVRAPTSTPREGSSRMSTLVSRPSHLPMTTFCWLPPLSWRTGVSTPSALIFSRSMTVRARALLLRSLTNGSPATARTGRQPALRLKRTLSSSTSPDERRCPSGTRTTPRSTASKGAVGRYGRPSSAIRPPSTPKIKCASSVRPAPTRPASPSTSQVVRRNGASLTLVPRRRRSTSSTTSPASWRPPNPASASASSPPTMPRTRALGHVRALQEEHAFAVLEDGDDVAQVQDLVEAVRDVQDGDAVGRQVADHLEQALALLGRERGGRFVHRDQARAPDEGAADREHPLLRYAQGADRGVEGEVDAEAFDVGDLRVDLRPVDQARARRLRQPQRHILDRAEVRHQVELLVDEAEPEGGRALRLGMAVGWPSTSTSPSSGASTPASKRMSVDLPAPLAPTRPCTSPEQDVEVHALERLDPSERLAEALHAD